MIEAHPVAKHPLNAICPYFTMFPIDFPYGVLREHAELGESVLDPFCGRGTTNFACRLLGLESVGVDSSPVAAAISAAKLVQVNPKDVITEARHILSNNDAVDVPVGEFWELAYDSQVLNELCRLRSALLADCSTPERIALRAVLLGALHGPRTKSSPSYFSNQSQRTYAPKPKYAVKYWKAHGLFPPPMNVLDVIERRAKRYYSELPVARGEAFLADSRHAEFWHGIGRGFDWVITSPPYFGMDTYLPDQWLRLWMVGGKPEVDYGTTSQLCHGRQSFMADLRCVWGNVATVCNRTAKLIVRFGSIRSSEIDPTTVIVDSLAGTPWLVERITPAGLADTGRRQVYQIVRGEVRNAIEEYDVWAALTDAPIWWRDNSTEHRH